MSYYVYSFEKLEVYKSALKLSISIRELVSTFPNEEKYNLTNQIKRATDSISANIAEGQGRASNFDQAHFTNIAYSSALEVINHLNLALQLAFVQIEDYQNIRLELDKIINQLNSLYKFQINNKNGLKHKTRKGQLIRYN